MAIILAIPMQLLAIAAAVAEGTTGTAKLSFLALKIDATSTAGVPELAELATEVEQFDKSFLSFFGRGERHVSELDFAKPESGLGKISKFFFTKRCIERNGMSAPSIRRSNSEPNVVVVSGLEPTFIVVNNGETPMNVGKNKITIEERKKDRLGFGSP
jgi:hypothetical protein